MKLLSIKPETYGQYVLQLPHGDFTPLVDRRMPIFLVVTQLTAAYDTRFETFMPGCRAYTAYNAVSGEPFQFFLTGPKIQHRDYARGAKS
jgi:hypothetical protein